MQSFKLINHVNTMGEYSGVFLETGKLSAARQMREMIRGNAFSSGQGFPVMLRYYELLSACPCIAGKRLLACFLACLQPQGHRY